MVPRSLWLWVVADAQAPLLSVALEEFQACVANCAALTLPDAYVECVNVQCQAATVLEEGPSIIHPIGASRLRLRMCISPRRGLRVTVDLSRQGSLNSGVVVVIVPPASLSNLMVDL